jgi:hypothetical protein
VARVGLAGGAAAWADVVYAPLEMIACAIVADCGAGLVGDCVPAAGTQMLAATRGMAGDQRLSLLWAEVAYSRFPDSRAAETTGFLPVTRMAPDDDTVLRALMAADGPALSVGNLVWLRPAGGGAYDLFQFNGLREVAQTRIQCPGEVR